MHTNYIKSVKLQICLLIIIICSIDQVVFAQDPVFSQNYSTPLYLNPAFAGNQGCARIRGITRNPVSVFGKLYQQYFFSFDKGSDLLEGGFGATASYFNLGAGGYSAYGFSGIYSYDVEIDTHKDLWLGLEASYLYKSYNSQGIYSDMIDPNTGIILRRTESYETGGIGNPDFAIGSVFVWKDFHAGAAVYHLLQPEGLNGIRTDLKINIHSGYNFDLGEQLNPDKFQVYTMFLLNVQNQHYHLNTGFNLFNRKFSIGTWIKTDLIFSYMYLVISAGFRKNNLAIGYSYDLPVTNYNFNRKLIGAHEISLQYFISCVKKKKLKAIKCPKF